MEIEYLDEGKIRIDKYLKEKTGFSREKIKKLIKDGKVLVNKNKIDPAYILKKNDTIEIIQEIKTNEEIIKPEEGKIDVIYEDE
ncbi:MAG: RNA-binding S4 domain-containing protein, partial [Candidatus Ratteibacteria bacterium]